MADVMVAVVAVADSIAAVIKVVIVVTRYVVTTVKVCRAREC